MKKLLIAVGLGLVIASSAQAADKIAVLNYSGIFQEVVKSSGADKVLENEFKGRLAELQKMEVDLQNKMQKLQAEGAKMKAADRSKLEKDIASQRQEFTTKAQKYEQDHTQRSEQERNKITTKINVAVKKVADDQKIDVVLDSNSLVHKSNSVKDLSADVLKQVK